MQSFRVPLKDHDITVNGLYGLIHTYLFWVPDKKM